MLGCGSYQVIAQPRGDGSLIGVVPWTQITWERVIDDTSQTKVTLDLQNPACCELLSVLRPWQHELAIYRDGVEIWVGPVYTIAQPPERSEIVGRDLTAWWDRRLIHEDHVYSNADLSTIFEDVSNDAMLPDNSPGLSVSATPCGVTATTTYLAAQHLVAGQTLRDIANIGVDFTALRRVILAGGTTVPSDPVGTLFDSHFQTPPQPSLDGSAQHNSLVVRGSGGGAAGDTISGAASDDAAAELAGLLEDVVTITTITDNVTARAAARTRVELQKEVVLIDQCVLAPTAPVTVEQLIAGAVVALKLANTCIPVDDSYRIQKVSGSISSTDGIEQITLAVEPVGTA